MDCLPEQGQLSDWAPQAQGLEFIAFLGAHRNVLVLNEKGKKLSAKNIFNIY